MKRPLLITALVMLVFACIVFVHRLRRPDAIAPVGNIEPATSSLALIIEPRDGTAPVLSMIAQARASIDLVMYEFDDQKIEDALVSAAQRGIAVRVLLSPGYQGASSKVNTQAYDVLFAGGVSVRWAPSYFALTHEKVLITDAGTAAQAALIMSFNLDAQYYAADRDFGIVDSNKNDVAAMESVFESDWQGNRSTNIASSDSASDLIWSPGARAALLALINSASTSLDIYNEEMGDPAVTQALVAAARRGVAVSVIMTDASEWHAAFAQLEAAGVQIRTYDPKAPLYIHAKVILADAGTPSAVAFIGSENFSPTSLDSNRELGIILAQQDITQSLARTFAADWQGGTLFKPP